MTRMAIDNNQLKRQFLVFTRDFQTRKMLKSLSLRDVHCTFRLGPAQNSSERINNSPATPLLSRQANIQNSPVNVHGTSIPPRLYPLESFQLSHLLVEHLTENKVADSVQIAPVEPSIKLNKNPEIWWFNVEERTLVNPGKKISLTGIELLLLKRLALSDRRVCSKTELIHGINRDPERYRGLEMCLSRLQEKFSTAANGERLFRSVRNRGYCLVQKIRVTRP